MQTIFFSSGNQTVAGNLLIADARKAPGMLILHGGGSGNKERFMDLQYALFEKGISSLAIDFRGVGQSTGIFQDGSLKNRTQDAESALKELKKYAGPVGVFGSSMGGFVASLLTDDPDVKIVVLASAAAYSFASEDKLLNDEFTREIRKENSWESSRSFIKLSSWKGKTLFMYGEFDTTIPDGVKEKYRQIAENNNGTFIVIPGAEHSLMAPKTDSGKKTKQLVLKTISDFVKKNL